MSCSNCWFFTDGRAGHQIIVLRIFNGFTRVQCQCWYWWFDGVMLSCAHANIPYLTRLALLHIFRVTVKYWNPFDNEIIADFSIDRLGSKNWPCPILAASLVRVISMAVGCQSRPLVHGDAMRILWVWGANLAGTQRQSHRRRSKGWIAWEF